MNTSKIFKAIAVAMLLFSIPPFAHATTTRDMGMGLYQYPWFIDGLQSYIYDNPAYLGKYFVDTLYTERIGVISGQNRGGIFYNPTGKLFIGMDLGAPVDTTVWNTTSVDSLFHKDVYSAKGKSKYTHSSSSQTFDAYQVELIDTSILDLTDPEDASALVGTNTTSPALREKLTQKNFSAMVAYQFNRFSIGAYFGYGTSWKHKRDATSATNEHEEYNLINADYSARLAANILFNNKVTMDVSAFYYMYVLDNNYTKDKPGIDFDMSYKSNGAMDIGGAMRINYQATNSHRFHFYGQYSMINRSTQGIMKINDTVTPANNVNAKDTFERKGQIIMIGVSDEMSMANSVTGFVGFATKITMLSNNYSGEDAITPANNVDTYKLTYQAIEVPIIVGLEANLSENWKGRFGVIQHIYTPVSYNGENITNQGTITTPTTFDDITSSQTSIAIGVSYKLDNFTFDWLANVDLFTVGPYFVSGKAWTSGNENPLALAFAIRYNFAVPTAPKIGEK
ncbi:MAG: hypothetical protein WHV26_06820 [Spirochaetota bacterium]